MKKTIFLFAKMTLSLLLLSAPALAQHSLDSLMASVSRNNKSIRAHNQLLEAGKTSFKTGLYLDNPTLEFDYMHGTPANAGNQTDITAVQRFDFPTVYAKRKELSNANIDKLDLEAKGFVQEVKLEAKLVFVELVYLNRFQTQLSARVANASRLQQLIQIKHEQGGTSALEVNRGNLNLIHLQNERRSTEARRAELHQQLSELNGGIPIEVRDTLYPIPPTLPPLEALYANAIQGDYTLKTIQQDQTIHQQEAQLSRALALPQLEGGYRHQSILGQTFNGFHAGISVPLFENKNKVQAAKQRALYYSLLEESHKNHHHNELESLYNQLLSLKNSTDSYGDLLKTNSEALLNKALQHGEISSVEYLTEIQYFYTAQDEFLELEKAYQLILATLFRYQL